jgi:hypothetical protein
MKIPEIKNHMLKIDSICAAYYDIKDKQWFVEDSIEVLYPPLKAELELALDQERIEAEND